MPHRVGLLNDSFPPLIDGVANVVVNYATTIKRHGGHAVVVTPDHPDAKDENFSFPVVRYQSIDMRRMVGYMAGQPFSPDTMTRLKGENLNILHSHCPIASTFLSRELREVLDIPLVFTYHTKFDIDIAKALNNKFLEKSAIHALVQNIEACDEVWVVSRGAGENLRSLGYTGDYYVMNNGVDLSRGRAEDSLVAKVTEPYVFPSGVPTFLFVGRLMWYKGIRIILDALKKLQDSGKDFRMVFVGSGTDMKEIVAYRDELQLSSRVYFAGPVADREALRAWYTRADLFLFPSTFDTNGLVVHEAAACSLASVLVGGSCASEDTIDGQNAFHIEENADSLAALLQRLTISQMHEAGQHAVEELYVSWEDAVKMAEARYDVVIENYRSGLYRAHETFADDFFAYQGQLMDALGNLDQMYTEFENRMRSSLESHYSAQAKKFSNLHDNIWHKLDRYL